MRQYEYGGKAVTFPMGKLSTVPYCMHSKAMITYCEGESANEEAETRVVLVPQPTVASNDGSG